jgi:two-component system, LuxR family, response regulator FixJ
MRGKTTIYIVDDDPLVLDTIAELVKPIGGRVEIFTRAEDFLDNYQADGPGCLVLDVRMPGMSGLELQSQLIEAGRQIPIIFVTGYADVRMAVDALKAGAINIFEKPFRPQELFDEIQIAIRMDEETWKQRDEEKNIEQKLTLLKPGEHDVIKLIVEGKTNAEIAADLQLSVRGVEVRRAKAMKTLRVDSKAELLRLMRITSASRSITANSPHD